MPYNLLLHRSQDFETFFLLLKNTFSNAVDQNVVLGLVQFLDEPSGQMAEIMPDGSVQMIDVT